MSRSVKQGTILLTLAQAWHALSSYVIFVSAARMLGEERFGDFGLVAWTMTTMETFVVAGVPRAVSYHIARAPQAAAAIARRGLQITFVIAGALTVLLVVTIPLIVALWRDTSAVNALRVSAFDFIAFAGFAVLVQAVNGLHLFGRQALIWLIYSSVKVVAVVGLLHFGGEIEWGILGYVIASAVASLVAVAGSFTPVRSGREGEVPGAVGLLRFGLPIAAQALTLMVMLNADLWAAKWASSDRRIAGAYVAAATLARALYFVFVAFGEALFPAVARELKHGRAERALALTRDVMGLLLCLLIPIVAVVTGAAAPILAAVYGSSSGPSETSFREAAPFLALLAPAAAALTLIAVFAAVLSAAGHVARTARFLVGLLAADVASVFLGAHLWGAIGAAAGALVGALAGLLVITFWSRTIFGAFLLPARTASAAIVLAIFLHLAIRVWSPEGWWVFAYGTVLLAGGWAALACTGVLPLNGLVKSQEGS